VLADLAMVLIYQVTCIDGRRKRTGIPEWSTVIFENFEHREAACRIPNSSTAPVHNDQALLLVTQPQHTEQTCYHFLRYDLVIEFEESPVYVYINSRKV
jgi:hypothetical protein